MKPDRALCRSTEIVEGILRLVQMQSETANGNMSPECFAAAKLDTIRVLAGAFSAAGAVEVGFD